MKKQLTVLLVLVISFVSYSQQNKITTTNTVTFTADISGILGVFCSGAFDPTRDSLFVEGLDWDGEASVVGNRIMTNSDTLNPGIFQTTLIISSTLDSVRWKFRAAPDFIFPNTGWETGSDRWFTFSEDSSIVLLDTIVPRIYPLISPISYVTMVFTLNVSGAKNRYNGLTIPLNEIEFIGIKGDKEYLGSLTEGCWCADDTANGTMKSLIKINNSTWNFYHTLLYGPPYLDSMNYQFCIMYPGADTMNGGVQPLANEFSQGINHTYMYALGCEVMFINNLFGSLGPTNVESIDSNIPRSYNLEQNYPNPFNPTTKIRYSIPEYSSVTLKVFNLLGEEIETLINSEQSAGVYEATFDASNVASGIYFYTLKTENASFTKKMILIK